jgi:hypothetical protein
MITKTKHWPAKLALASTILAISACGCSAMAPFGGTSNKQASAQTPPPLVQNCGIVSIGSPSNYACDGKVYTAFQLAKLRQDWEKSHGG